MTWQFDINNAVSIADDCGVWAIIWKDLGIAQGVLEVLGSGDGRTTFENSGQTAGPAFDVLTAGSSVWVSSLDNSWSNTNAWMRVRFVGTTFEFLIQREQYTSFSYEDDLKIFISPTGFTSGTATATVAPTATDQQQIHGVSGATAVFGNYTLDSHIHIGFNDAPGSTGHTSFFVIHTVDSTKVVSAVWIFDVVDQQKTGDLQPWITYSYSFSSGVLGKASIANNTANCKAYRDYGGGTEAFVAMRAHYLVDASNNTLFPGAVPQQPEDGLTRSFPAIWGSYILNLYKGVSSFVEWKGANSRVYPDTVDLTLSSAKCHFDDVLIPWEQNSTPL